jgi:hypothetical protein
MKVIKIEKGKQENTLHPIFQMFHLQPFERLRLPLQYSIGSLGEMDIVWV